MNQYSITKNGFSLKVKSAPLVLRALFVIMTAVSLLGPIMGLWFTISSGAEFHIKHLISLGVGGLIGFFLLRFTLWNIYGQEIFEFEEGQVSQIADYKWFKTNLKNLDIEGISFEILPVGYDEDGKGVLCLNNANHQIISSVKMPITELETLVKKLKA